jgi:pilus assembly protein CpaB
VRVNDVAGVAGFVLPGMKVDILVTGRPPDANGDTTFTVLQNVLVLSAGQTIQADAKGQAMPAPTVTLLVSPEDAETLTLATRDGQIQLVLRNSSDMDIAKTPGRFVTELYGMGRKPAPKPVAESKPRPRPVVSAQAPPPPPPPVVVAPPPPDQVVVIRGTTRTVEMLPNRANN